MDTLDTLYGPLQGVSATVYYNDGCLKRCTLKRPNELRTPCGVFVPRYDDDGARRKHIHSLTFYKSGYVESIELQGQQPIQTSLGLIPAEHIVLYETGQIKRIFPLNGRITGYWSEEDEYGMAQVIDISLSFGTIRQKIVAASFYEDGAVKSLTFWPEDTLHVPTPLGTIETRTGIAFYPQGQIRSLEPKYPTLIETPIGKMMAWNANVLGVHGEANSLCLDIDGAIQSFMTSTDQITIRDAQGSEWTMKPGARESLCDEHDMEAVPLRIEFLQQTVRFNASAEHEYDITQHTFSITHVPLPIHTTAETCHSM